VRIIGRPAMGAASDATVLRPRQKVKAALDASLQDGAARVTIQLISGGPLGEIVMEAKGSLADPLSDRDTEAKLRDGARLGGTEVSGVSIRLRTSRA
jgi:hypothetical protein